MTFSSQGLRGEVDLRLGAILNILAIDPDAFNWTVTGLEAAGNPFLVATLHRLSDSSATFSSTSMRLLLDPTVQIIDGILTAYLPGDGKPALRIRAVDSAYWDVESEDQALLQRLRARVRGVTDIPVTERPRSNKQPGK